VAISIPLQLSSVPGWPDKPCNYRFLQSGKVIFAEEKKLLMMCQPCTFPPSLLFSSFFLSPSLLQTVLSISSDNKRATRKSHFRKSFSAAAGQIVGSNVAERTSNPSQFLSAFFHPLESNCFGVEWEHGSNYLVAGPNIMKK
jgi:hypothetical protein